MTEKEDIIKLSKLISEVLAVDDFIDAKVAIIAGHYILLYDKITDSLRPVIYEDLENDANKKFAKTRAKNFPRLSFKIGVRLYREFYSRNIDAKGVLVVNDESLNNEDFRGDKKGEHFNLVKSKSKRLRKEYFANDFIPLSYTKILSEENITQDVFFENFENVYDTGGQKSSTIFLSEKKICEKFKANLPAYNIDDKVFKTSSQEVDNDGIQEFKIKPLGNSSVCLIEASQCNCGGKTFQFYYDLINKGFNTIIFFVPKDCIDQVNIGSGLINKSDKFSQKKLTIINISHLESEHFNDENFEKDIYISIFKNF